MLQLCRTVQRTCTEAVVLAADRSFLPISPAASASAHATSHGTRVWVKVHREEGGWVCLLPLPQLWMLRRLQACAGRLTMPGSRVAANTLSSSRIFAWAGSAEEQQLRSGGGGGGGGGKGAGGRAGECMAAGALAVITGLHSPQMCTGDACLAVTVLGAGWQCSQQDKAGCTSSLQRPHQSRSVLAGRRQAKSSRSGQAGLAWGGDGPWTGPHASKQSFLDLHFAPSSHSADRQQR